MPRRILVVAFAAVLVLFTLQSPAAAKGPDSSTLTGPGIGTEKLVSSTIYPSLDTLLRVTRFWDSAAGMTTWDADPPAGDLGPRFEVTYHVPDLHDPSSGKKSQLRQNLYPFAAAGPVVHMAEGQALYDMELPHGWLAVDQGLERLVTQLGGTRTPVETNVEPAAHEAASTDSDADDGSGRAYLGWVAAAAVLLAAAVGGRRVWLHRR